MPWVVTLTILVASAFLMDMSFTMITPFLPVYLSSELGAKASEVDMWSGAVFAVTFFVSGLLGPVWGVLADRKSRKLMALRASIGLTISYALCGIVQTPMQLFAARFFQGLCAGLYPALLALLAASIPARKTGLSMGLMQGGMTVGAVVGPFVGGVLADYFGMRESFFVASVALGLISLLIGFCIKEKPRTIKVTSRNWFDWSVIRQPAIFKMLMGGDTDFTAAFSAVGHAFDGSLTGALDDAYTAVFGPQDTGVTVPQDAADPAAYTAENTPGDVCLTQQVLGFAYANPLTGPVTDRFGYRQDPNGGGQQFHYGLDIAADEGAVITAFAAGTVTAVGDSAELGNYVTVQHPGGFVTLYAHCSRINASSGQQVRPGDPIAEVGHTGNATGPHLHFELMKDGVYVNPIYYYAAP